MTRSATVLVTLLAFLAALLIIGTWAARRTHNTADFLLASRRLGAWPVALGYAANSVNAWLLMIVGAAAFVSGICAAWIWVGVLLGCIVNLWFVAPRLRTVSVGQGSATLVQVLSADCGERLQPIVARSAVFIIVAMLLLQAGAMLRAAGGLFVADFGIASGSVIVCSVLLLTVCIFAGGLRAATACDAVQTAIVLLVALFLLLPALIAAGGLSGLHAALAVEGTATLDWLGGRSGVVAVAFVAGAFGIGLAMCGQPHAVNRFMAARDEATLRLARWLALGWIAVLLGAVQMCGWCASVLYSGLEHSEQALFTIAAQLLPSWLGGLVTAVLLVAIILATGSQLLAMSASLAMDLRRPPAPVSLAWNRAALVAAAAMTVCVTWFAPAGMIDYVVFAFTTLGASFGPLLLVRLSGKRTRPGSTLGALWAGFVLSLLFHLLPDSPGDFLERVLPFVAGLGIALTGGERRRNPDRADRSQETVHDRVAI